MKPTGPSSLVLPAGYADWLAQLYGRIGRDILERQHSAGWGAKVIDRLARDLKDAFADMRGWSPRKLKYMRFFAQHGPDGLFGQQAADQLPRFHIVTLLTQLADAVAPPRRAH